MNPIERINEYRTRLATLKTERSEWDTHWKELNDYLQPRTSRFFTSDKNKGGKVNQKINWKIQLNVRNALDKQDMILQLTLADGTGVIVTPQAPRTFILTNSFSF